MYDIIGDVHGYAQLLKKLLIELGYKKTSSGYSNPGRKAVFVGDFVNRGPQIRKSFRMIRTMVENGNAMAILGNHEINLIISYLKNQNDIFQSGDISVLKTVDDFAGYPDEWNDHLKWLRTLPLFLELDGIRVVHACWSDEAVEYLKLNLPSGKIKKEFFLKMYKNPGSQLAQNVWLLTKGIHFKLPGDLKLKSNKGVSPRSFRLRWWEEPAGKTFEELSFENKFQLPDYTIPSQILPATLPYSEKNPPLFFGHFCRANGPHLIRPNLCCIDACVNGSKSLLAYPWDGEQSLSVSKIIRVKK
jgi:hypothetical protein